MIEPPQIVDSPHQLVACLPLRIPRSEIQTAMGPGIVEVMGAVTSQKIGPTGPWLTHHFQRPTEVFDFEICVPVTAPVSPMGRVKPGEIRAAKVARTVYHGPYEGLGAAWGEFIAWVDAHNHTATTDFWERYLAGPESSPDPAAWRTELNLPLAD